MEELIVLEWEFTPQDYFEEDIRIERDGYVMTIGNGIAEATLRPGVYESDKNLCDALYQTLHARFFSEQLFSHKPFQLPRSVSRHYPDGRTAVTIFVDTLRTVTSIGKMDVVEKDQDGNVVHDTKRDRRRKKAQLASLIEDYRSQDTFVDSLLNSYDQAVNDRKNELVHLYEIRDSLAKKFGGASSAKTALGISQAHWSRLGQLCNDEPLRQGRHRGKNLGDLRNATEAELGEARELASNLIYVYLAGLKKQDEGRV